MDILQAVKESELCQDLTATQFAEFIETITIHEQNYQSNEILFYTSEPAKLFLLINGNVTIAKDTLNGKRILGKSIVEKGKIIGDVYFASNRNPFWEYGLALKQTKVIEIGHFDPESMKTLDVELQNQLLINLLKSISEKFEYIGEKVKMVSETSVRAKIVNYLVNRQLSDGSILLTETREEVADYLDITRPSLSRELSRMQKEGIIPIQGKKMWIMDEEVFASFIQ